MMTLLSKLERIYILILLIMKKFGVFESRNRPPFNSLRYMPVSSYLFPEKCTLSQQEMGFVKKVLSW